MSCSRCQGLMVSETLFNPLEGSIHTWVPLTRCLNCGNVEDSWICRARALPDQLRRSTRPGPQRRGLRREESEGIRLAGRLPIVHTAPNEQGCQRA
jgi:hypothetical protein